jgi:membrane associated rhomboid family serine protease
MSDQGLARTQVTDLVVGTGERAVMVARWAGLLWLLESVDWLILSQRLNQFGIRPRELDGLWGILFSPFLHGGFGHLIANTIPFILLGFLTSARRKMDFYVVAIGSALIGGLGTWLIGGAGTVHIGASGVVFGMLGFLMGRGIFERSLSSIALSTTVTVMFGGMLWGVLPTVGPGISWEGHLFGFIGGMIIARLMGGAIRKQKQG